MDNVTAFESTEYNEKILKTVPYYNDFAFQTADIVKTTVGTPKQWLDAGCGSGNMIDEVYYV